MSDLIDRQELHKRLNERFGDADGIAEGEFWNHGMVREVIDGMPNAIYEMIDTGKLAKAIDDALLYGAKKTEEQE